MRRSIPFVTACAGLVLALALAPRAAHANFNGTIPDQTLTVGVAFSITLPERVNAGTVTYSIAETLPGGLSFNASTRVLSGTPTQAQAQTEYTYQAFSERDYNTTSLKFKITILAVQDITLSKSQVGLTEGGSAGTYNVKLPTAPTGNVTVSVTSGDTGAVTVNPSSLTFTTNNYNTNQQVTLTPVSDNDGADESVTITHSAAGGGYDNKSATLTATVADDDRGFTFSPSSLTLDEGGAGKSFTVALAAEPAGAVTVSMTAVNIVFTERHDVVLHHRELEHAAIGDRVSESGHRGQSQRNAQRSFQRQRGRLPRHDRERRRHRIGRRRRQPEPGPFYVLPDTDGRRRRFDLHGRVFGALATDDLRCLHREQRHGGGDGESGLAHFSREQLHHRADRDGDAGGR